MTSYTETYVHCIWATKQREPQITAALETELYNTIATACRAFECTAIAIGGSTDHVHVLVRVYKHMPVSKLVEQIKQNSAELIDRVTHIPGSLQWQDGHGAFVVSKHSLGHVKNYVLEQKERHAENRLIDELEYIDQASAQPTPHEELRSASVGC